VVGRRGKELAFSFDSHTHASSDSFLSLRNLLINQTDGDPATVQNVCCWPAGETSSEGGNFSATVRSAGLLPPPIPYRTHTRARREGIGEAAGDRTSEPQNNRKS
jgi:hypothetical protein